MAPSKNSNEVGDDPHMPNLTKASEASMTSNPSASIPSPKPATTGLPRTPPVTSRALPSGVEAASKDWVKFGSKLRNQLPEDDDEHYDDISPQRHDDRGGERGERGAGFAEYDHRFDGYDEREDTPTGPAIDQRGPDISHSLQDRPAEPLNPGNTPHDKWETISVHTAKCDGCGKHNNKVVQRCKRCNLQYCQPCLRTRDDGQHFANVGSLDWTPKPMIRSKRTNEETKKRKAAPKASANKNPKQASRAPTRAPTRPPSERVQLAEARRRSIIPDDEEFIDPNLEEAPRRRRQRVDDFEMIDEAPRKRYYSEDEDVDRMPKKPRGGRAVDREYAYEESSGEERAGGRVRYTQDRHHPRDQYGDEMERSASRQSDVYDRARPMGFAPSPLAHTGPREFAAPSPRPSSRTGRAPYMSQDEAIAAAWAQRQETKRKAERDERLQAARGNHIIQELLAAGKDEEADEVLRMAEALAGMSGAKQ